MTAKGKLLVFTVIVAVLASSCAAKRRKNPTFPARVDKPTPNAPSAPATARALGKLIVNQCLSECLIDDCKKCCRCVESVLNPGGVDVCDRMDCSKQQAG